MTTSNQYVYLNSLAVLLSFSCGLLIVFPCSAETKLPNQFVLRSETHALWPEARQAVANVLREKFGSPANLVFWKALPVDYGDVVEPTALRPGWKLAAGRDLFMAKCADCHGAGGDGNGPAASKHFPRPRDFRLGLFKWTSTRMH